MVLKLKPFFRSYTNAYEISAESRRQNLWSAWVAETEYLHRNWRDQESAQEQSKSRLGTQAHSSNTWFGDYIKLSYPKPCISAHQMLASKWWNFQGRRNHATGRPLPQIAQRTHPSLAIPWSRWALTSPDQTRLSLGGLQKWVWRVLLMCVSPFKLHDMFSISGQQTTWSCRHPTVVWGGMSKAQDWSASQGKLGDLIRNCLWRLDCLAGPVRLGRQGKRKQSTCGNSGRGKHTARPPQQTFGPPPLNYCMFPFWPVRRLTLMWFRLEKLGPDQTNPSQDHTICFDPPIHILAADRFHPLPQAGDLEGTKWGYELERSSFRVWKTIVQDSAEKSLNSAERALCAKLQASNFENSEPPKDAPPYTQPFDTTTRLHPRNRLQDVSCPGRGGKAEGPRARCESHGPPQLCMGQCSKAIPSRWCCPLSSHIYIYIRMCCRVNKWSTLLGHFPIKVVISEDFCKASFWRWGSRFSSLSGVWVQKSISKRGW